MGITCGIDWAEAHNDIADDTGYIVARARIGPGADGFNALLRLIDENGGSPKDTPIAIETDKRLFVVALAEVGFTVYPINPRAVARYRERRGQAGAHRILVTPRFWRTFCAPTRTRTERCRPSASTDERSRHWPANIRRPSGPCTKPSVGSGRYCSNSIPSLCRLFRT